MSKYVGNIKEDRSFVVEDSCGSAVVKDVKFCRKRMKVVDEGNSYLIVSEPAVPLNEILTADVIPKKPQAQQAVMDKVATELFRFENEHPDYHYMTDALLVLASSRLPLAKVTRTVTHRYESDLDLIEMDGRYCSQLSIDRALKVEPVYHASNVYYGSVGQAINYLLCRGQLVIQLASVGGELFRVVMTEAEGRRYRKRFTRKDVREVCVVADSEVIRILM